MQLVAGQKKTLPVGDLPRDVAEYLGCHPAIVYLGHREVLKIVNKHGENVRVEQLQCLHLAIRDGEYRADPGRKRSVSIYYQNPYDGHLYLIGIKPADKGSEVWICTLFQTTAKKIRNQRERSVLLRQRAIKR
jgi:hypothetical protein